MTIAQQLNVKNFPFEIKDANGKQIYYENSDGYWSKYAYDANGNEIYFEESNGSWYKNEYDANGKQIYQEYSNGTIVDNRPKPKPKVILSVDEIAKKFGLSVDQLQIKK